MKTYRAPGRLKKKFGRMKRRVPDFVVDILDGFYSHIRSSVIPYPYTSGEFNDSGNPANQPFFIIGSGRSGNTLLRKLLMDRYDVVIPPEIPGLGNTIREFSRMASSEWVDIVEHVIYKFVSLADINVSTTDTSHNYYTYNLLEQLDVDFNKIISSLKEIDEESRSMSSILNEIYSAYSLNKYGKNIRWGDKTPWNIFHYGRINKVYPNALYVHMLRDGRDSVVSYVKSLGKLMNISYSDASYRWRDSVKKADQIKMLAKSRYMEIKYEDLVTEPDLVINNVAEFLCLKKKEGDCPSMQYMGDANLSHHIKLADKVNAKSIGAWKESLCDSDYKIVMRIISKELKNHGYAI